MEDVRLEELERLYEFCKLHTGKESISGIVSTLGSKIYEAFKFRGNTFGRLLLPPEPGVEGLISVAEKTRKNYIPLFHLVYGKEWHHYQQMSKYESGIPYQVACAQSALLTHLFMMCKGATDWDEFIHTLTVKWKQKAIQDLCKGSYYDYRQSPAKRVDFVAYDLPTILALLGEFKDQRI